MATIVELPAAEPHFVGEPARPLFVWHHSPPSQLRRGAAVVLCPPIGYEYTSVYRTWRVLAEGLAALGFDIVRLDYDGTGNSTGSDDESGRVSAWLRSIEVGIAEARRLSGSSAIALLGLRAGAVLALQAAAASGGLERLVLWSPFPSGRAYVRELTLQAGLFRQDYERDDDTARGLNVGGFLFTKETVATFDKWVPDDLTTQPAKQVLLIDHDGRSTDTKLNTRLEALGSRVTRICPSGTAAMLRPPELASVPEDVLDAIATWFGGWRGDQGPAAGPGSQEYAPAGPVSVGGYRERGVRFGVGDRLFGIVTSPADESSRLPAIILLNTSVDYHIGPSRLYVPLARQWAADGHLVLRFDLGGIGDSRPPDGAAGNSAYPDHAIDDLREAIAFVKSHSAGRSLVVGGLCSGGWFALEAVRQGLPIDAIISINPPVYIREVAAAAQRLAERDAIDYYRQSMRAPHKWLKGVHGDVSGVSFIRLIAPAVGRRLAGRLAGLLGQTPDISLANDLRALAHRGIRAMVVFSEGDKGLDYFQSNTGPLGADADVQQFIRHVVVEGAGHSFRPLAAQARLREILVTFVASQAEQSLAESMSLDGSESSPHRAVEKIGLTRQQSFDSTSLKQPDDVSGLFKDSE